MTALLGDGDAKVGLLQGLKLPEDAKKTRERQALLLAEGQRLLASLRASDQAHETAIAKLPARTREYCRDKGFLYLAIKQVNDAASEAYSNQPPEAAPFNLRILYRRGGQAKGKQGGEEGAAGGK